MKSSSRLLLVASLSLVLACKSHDEPTQPAAIPSSLASIFGTDAGASTPIALPTDADAAPTVRDAAAFEDDQDASVPDDFALRFERTACLGTCPMYVVHVDAHGAVTFSSRLYVGDHFVDGCATKNIGTFGVINLNDAVNKARFFSLQNEYVGGPTDQPSIIVTVTRNHKTKTVKHYKGAPIPAADALHLYAGEDAYDHISGAVDFARSPDTLTPCTYTGK